MPAKRRKISEEEEQQPLFLDSINIMDLPLNGRLPKIEILKTSYNKSSNKISLKLNVPLDNRLINIYFKLNGEKRDMYYQVSPGNYTFSFVPNQDYNNIELFYTTNSARSETVFSFYKEG
jgi:hypothetical protein